MKPKHFLLRVYSVRKLGPSFDNRDTRSDPTPPCDLWEVRAETASAPKMSLFYQESSSRTLPRVDSVLHITVAEHYIVTEDPESPE